MVAHLVAVAFADPVGLHRLEPAAGGDQPGHVVASALRAALHPEDVDVDRVEVPDGRRGGDGELGLAEADCGDQEQDREQCEGQS